MPDDNVPSHATMTEAMIAAQMAFGELAQIARFPLYAFSPDGFAVSLIRRQSFIMKPIRCGQYSGLSLASADGLKRVYLHRLIAEAFHGPCPPGMVCCHNDGDRRNNAALNLRWDTPANNNEDQHKHGKFCGGEKNGMVKLTSREVMAMRRLRETTGKPYHYIADIFDVSTMTAFRAITKRAWSHP